MASFYLDNDVAVRRAGHLRRYGHTATTALDQGMPHARDYAHLLTAAQHGWTFITHNRRHFIELHLAWCGWLPTLGIEMSHAGVIVLPQSPQLALFAERINDLVQEEVTLENQLYLWTSGAGWVLNPHR